MRCAMPVCQDFGETKFVTQDRLRVSVIEHCASFSEGDVSGFWPCSVAKCILVMMEDFLLSSGICIWNARNANLM